MKTLLKENDWVYNKTRKAFYKLDEIDLIRFAHDNCKKLIDEYEVETCVQDWDEISITHKLITKKYLKSLMPKFSELDFACDSYYADNGVIRICLVGNEERLNPLLQRGSIPQDICIFPHKGYCTIMRNGAEGYSEKENRVVDIICGGLNEWKAEKKLRKQLKEIK